MIFSHGDEDVCQFSANGHGALEEVVEYLVTTSTILTHQYWDAQSRLLVAEAVKTRGLSPPSVSPTRGSERV